MKTKGKIFVLLSVVFIALIVSQSIYLSKKNLLITEQEKRIKLLVKQVEKLNKIKTKNKNLKYKLDSIEKQSKQKAYVVLNRTTLRDALKNYKHVSKRLRIKILNAIEKASVAYNINQLLLYSVIAVESSFRPYIAHKQITINGKRDRAIGLGGIVYSWHGEDLKKQGIIETKTDLYDPELNIMAMAFILNKYREMALKKGVDNKLESSLRRYYGSNFKSYSDKIFKIFGKLVNNRLNQSEKKTIQKRISQ